MYKMLIVEDEAIEREALRDFIHWEDFGIKVVGAVESGLDAINFAQDNKIDILFTDIKLIGMTGLETAKRLLGIYPELKVIVTSGYHEFEYAKEAIDINAVSFISKPVDIDELNNVISKTVNICNDEKREKLEKHRLKDIVKKSLPYLKDKFFNELIEGKVNMVDIAENLEYFGILTVQGYYTVTLGEIDNFREITKNMKREEIELIIAEGLEIARSIVNSDVMHVFHVSEGRYCFALYMSRCDIKEIHDKLFNFAKYIQESFNSRQKYTITVGVGNPVEYINELRFSHKKASDALGFKFFMGNGQIIFYKDVNHIYKKSDVFETEDVEKSIINSIEACNKEQLNLQIERLFYVFEQKKYTAVYIRSICLNLLAKMSMIVLDMNESFKNVFGEEIVIWERILNLDTVFDIAVWMKNISNTLVDFILEKKKIYNKKVMNDILQYIENNYCKNITTIDLSKEVYLSPSYIGKIFKKEMGESFTDYLVRFKMEKAKGMLKDTDMKIYQVGLEVGYTNISYFCSAFKKLYGVSPNEYRERQ